MAQQNGPFTCANMNCFELQPALCYWSMIFLGSVSTKNWCTLHVKFNTYIFICATLPRRVCIISVYNEGIQVDSWPTSTVTSDGCKALLLFDKIVNAFESCANRSSFLVVECFIISYGVLSMKPYRNCCHSLCSRAPLTERIKLPFQFTTDVLYTKIHKISITC